jgi:uncharacterized membrane protein
MEDNTKKQPNAMAIISYIGFLCLIPLLTNEKDEFVRFHMKQGMVLFIAEVVVWAVILAVPFLWFIGNLFGIIWLVLSIIGIMNVVNGQKKEIPFLGKFAEMLKI